MEIMKIGDKVRFLSEVGGGVVTGFRGKDIVLWKMPTGLTFRCRCVNVW